MMGVKHSPSPERRLRMYRFVCATAAALLLAAGGAAAGPPPATDRLNKRIDNFALTAADGKAGSLRDLKDPKAVVVVFLSFDCPVSNFYATTLSEMHAGYASKGVSFVGVVAGDEPAAVVAKK